MAHNAFETFKSFTTSTGKTGRYYSLPALAKTFPGVKRLPVSIRVVLESVLRNVDGKKVTEEHVKQLAPLGAQGRAHRRDPVRPRAHPAAGFHRHPGARRPRRDA